MENEFVEFWVYLLLGWGIAYVSSIPLGPVNLAIAQASLNTRRVHARRIAVGASVVEGFYCLVGVAGAHLVSAFPVVMLSFKMLSIPILLAMGVLNIRKHARESEPTRVQEKLVAEGEAALPRRGFWLGLSLNLLNPFLIPYWIAVAAWLRTNNLLGSTFWAPFVFTVGVASGTLSLLLTIDWIATRNRASLSGNTMAKVNHIIGWLFVVLAVLALGVVLRNMVPPPAHP